jgi:hypothetical protein
LKIKKKQPFKMSTSEEFLSGLSIETVNDINDQMQTGFISQHTLELVEALVDAIAESTPINNLVLYRGFEEYDNITSTAPLFLFKSLEKDVALDYADPYLAEIHYPQPVLGINMDPYWGDYEQGGFTHKREYVFLTLPFERFQIDDEYTDGDKEVLVVDSLPYPLLSEIKRRYRSFYQPEKIKLFDKIVRRAEELRRTQGWITIVKGKQVGDVSRSYRGELLITLTREFGHPSEPLPIITVNTVKGQYIIK